jgi:hypothetical protein
MSKLPCPPLPSLPTGTYIHTKSNALYDVQYLEYLESDLTPMVSYIQVETGFRFTRPYHGFVTRFQPQTHQTVSPIIYNYQRGARIALLLIEDTLTLSAATELVTLLSEDITAPLPPVTSEASRSTLFAAMQPIPGHLDGLIYGAVRNTLMEVEDDEEDEALESLRQLSNRSLVYSLPPTRTDQVKGLARASTSKALHHYLAGDQKAAEKALKLFLDLEISD